MCRRPSRLVRGIRKSSVKQMRSDGESSFFCFATIDQVSTDITGGKFEVEKSIMYGC